MGQCRFIRLMKSGPGPAANESNEANKVAARTLDADTARAAGASGADEANGSNASQVLALGPNIDSLDALASGQALTRMNVLNLKSWPWARL